VIERYPNGEEATQARRLLVELADLEADLVYQAAMASFDLEDHEQAALLLQAVVERYPGTVSAMAARCNLGVAYEHLGKWQAADAVYGEVIKMAGNDEAFTDMIGFARDHQSWIREYRL
jgi:tetratricopeptide (TPR) repeat protein